MSWHIYLIGAMQMVSQRGTFYKDSQIFRKEKIGTRMRLICSKQWSCTFRGAFIFTQIITF
jgi:hypothetical protein